MTDMALSVTRRSACRFCSGKNLDAFLTLPALPMTDDFLKTPEQEEFRHPLTVYLCAGCGLVQTQHDIDYSRYYRDYQYTSFSSDFTQRFMQRLAGNVWSRWGMQDGDRVIEIGSGDGGQLGMFKNLGAQVLGFEPSAPLAERSRAADIPVINGLFIEGAEKKIPPDMRPAEVVMLSYTFDHLPDPLSFLRSVARVLNAKRGLLVIEVHDFTKIFERREFCLFEHEHSIYPTAATLQRMLASAGLKMIEVGLLPEEQRRANSLLVVATPENSLFSGQALPLLPLGPETDIAACRAFGLSVENSLKRMSAMLTDRRQRGIKVAGYGAGGRGVMTMALTANPGDIAYVCDKNTLFHGRYTPVSHVQVAGPERLLTHPVDEVIVYSFGYFDEISRELTECQSKGTRLISLLDIL